MRAVVLQPQGGRERGLVALGALLSLLLHAGAAAVTASIEPAAPEKRTQWIEMTITETPPPPPPEVTPEPEPPPPPPEPEPPKPKPKPKEPEVVQFDQTAENAPTDAPLDAKPAGKPVRKIVQGLSNQSFVDGLNTGLSVRAGTTTSARAGSELMDREDATEFATVPYAAVATAPKAAGRPILTVPEEVRALGVSGRVQVEMTIGADGRVVKVDVVQALHPLADAACVRDLKAMRWKPGLRDGSPVVVTGVPYTCRYEELQ